MASAAAISIALVLGAPGTASAGPHDQFISCPGGQYRARQLDQCPPYPHNPISVTPGRGGGGPGNGGGLIGTIGRVLGGLTGGLL